MSGIRKLSAEETESIRRTPGRSGHPLCAIVIGSSWHEPIACAYPPGHTGNHSWDSIPQFDPSHEARVAAESLRTAALTAAHRLSVDACQDVTKPMQRILTKAVRQYDTDIDAALAKTEART